MKLETRKFLHDLVAEVLGLSGDKVIWSNQDGVKLAAPAAVISTYSHRGEAMEDHLPTSDPDVVNLKVPTAFVLEVRYFGKKNSFPVDIMDDFVRCMEKPTVVDKCFQNGVAVLYADPVQDITALLDNKQQFEPAAAVDFHCRYTSSIDDKTGSIDTVNINAGTIPASIGGWLIYGHISRNGTVTDLNKAIPVNVNIKYK